MTRGVTTAHFSRDQREFWTEGTKGTVETKARARTLGTEGTKETKGTKAKSRTLGTEGTKETVETKAKARTMVDSVFSAVPAVS